MINIINILHLNRICGSLLMALLLLTTTTSCDDHLTNLNTPQDQMVVSEVDIAQLGQAFAFAQYHGVFGQFGSGGYNFINVGYANSLAQYMAPTADFLEDNFIPNGRRDNFIWNYFYNNAAPMLHFVEEKSAEEGLDLQNAVARVWRVVAYSLMTDLWGPIPYSEFGNGETHVPYDSQEEIYMDFFETLDDAVAIFEQNAGGNAFGSHDLVYGGNIDQWLKFTNSLRLRLAMRIRFVETGLSQQEAEKAVAAGVMTDPSDGAFVATNENTIHPLTQITAWGEFRMAAAMESVLGGYEDPRLPEYYNPAAEGDWNGTGSPYKGLRNGLPRVERSTDLNDFYSHVDTKWQPVSAGGTIPSLEVMHASEVYFLRAEGALQDWEMQGNAEELYNEGIRTSMRERTNATNEEIEAYISSDNTPKIIGGQWNTPALSDIPVAFETDPEKQMEQILTQKWLAVYPDGKEAWAEYRRTRFPKLYPIIESNNPDIPEDGIFRRVLYPSGEFDNNAQAVEAAINNMLNGPDANTTRLWWDAKP